MRVCHDSLEHKRRRPLNHRRERRFQYESGPQPSDWRRVDAGADIRLKLSWLQSQNGNSGLHSPSSSEVAILPDRALDKPSISSVRRLLWFEHTVLGVAMIFLVIFSILVVGFIALAISNAEKAKNSARQTEQLVRSLPDFSADNVCVSTYDQHGLAIDTTRGILMLIGKGRIRRVGFEKIVSAEIVEDNVSLITTKKGGLGRVVVGGLLAGGVGAIVGGLTGTQRSKTSTGVRRVDLVVLVDDFNNPRHSVTFLTWPGEEGLKRNSAIYTQAIQKAQLWQGRITVAMRRASEFASAPQRALTGWQPIQSSADVASAPTAVTLKAPATPAYRVVGRRYRIIAPLGGGAMKKVYLAEDSRLGWRKCALAEMLDNYSNAAKQGDAVRAFQRECDLLATLDNPHIPKIFDHFSEEHHHYLVMEYVDGATLENLQANSGQSLGENVVIEVARQILETLSYLHGRNPSVLYRDLKPSNVMITDSGIVKLVDFGIARNFEPSTAMTLIGTPGYAAPEQYRGAPEARSDLYALGAVMHRALTGRDPATEPPFSFPPVADLRPDVQPALGGLIDQALSYKIEGRPSSADEMAERLAALGLLSVPTALKSALEATTGVIALPRRASLRFCPNCGTEVAKDAAICTTCSAVVSDSAPQPKGPSEPNELSASDTLEPASTNPQSLSDRNFYLITGGFAAVIIFIVWIATTVITEIDVSQRYAASPDTPTSGQYSLSSENEPASPSLQKTPPANNKCDYRVVEVRAKVRIILVPPACTNLESMTALGKRFHAAFADDSIVVAPIFDNAKAAKLYDQVVDSPDSLSSSQERLYDRHFVATYNRNENTDYEAYAITLKGLNGPQVDVDPRRLSE